MPDFEEMRKALNNALELRDTTNEEGLTSSDPECNLTVVSRLDLDVELRLLGGMTMPYSEPKQEL